MLMMSAYWVEPYIL